MKRLTINGHYTTRPLQISMKTLNNTSLVSSAMDWFTVSVGSVEWGMRSGERGVRISLASSHPPVSVCLYKTWPDLSSSQVRNRHTELSLRGGSRGLKDKRPAKFVVFDWWTTQLIGHKLEGRYPIIDSDITTGHCPYDCLLLDQNGCLLLHQNDCLRLNQNGLLSAPWPEWVVYQTKVGVLLLL